MAVRRKRKTMGDAVEPLVKPGYDVPDSIQPDDREPEPLRVTPSRVGRVGVMTYVSTDARKALAWLALEEETSQQGLMREALELLFEKRKMKPIS